MNPSELKAKVEDTGSFFFTQKTMKFFGDRMSNYGVRKVKMDTDSEKDIECWELWRRKPVNGGLTSSAYFNAKTFKREWLKD